MKSNLIRIRLAALAAVATTCAASAVTITIPLSYSTQYLVGTATFVEIQGNAEAVEAAIAQNILNLTTVSPTATIDGRSYVIGTDFDYSGSILGTGFKPEGAGTSAIAGYDYALAKYDGTNAGYILFYLGGEATTLPAFSYNIWSNGESPESYEISHFTLFNTDPSEVPGVPEGGSTLVLLGGALMVIGGVARRGFGIEAA